MREIGIRTCYVSMPFGRKVDLRGRTIDFDRLYHGAIKPGLVALGIECVRLDEATLPGGQIQRALFSLIMASDLMIAEVTTPNPNVFYELGIRHLAQRGRTILLMARGTDLPFNLSTTYALAYDMGPDGTVDASQADALRDALAGTIQASQDRLISDSPIYAFFPDLRLELPGELAAGRPRTYPKTRTSGVTGLASKEQSARQVRAAAEEIRASPDSDPFAYLDLLRAARDASNWRQLVEMADEAPPAIRRAPQVIQLLALALNRLGDADRAKEVIETLIAETGGDGETFGILGRIYKDQYEAAVAAGDQSLARHRLEQAIAAYRSGFEKSPDDYYPGVNAVGLLRQLQANDAAAASELQSLLPRVRAVVDKSIQKGPPTFWAYATQMQLAAIAGDWPHAVASAREAIAQAPSGWMIESSQRDLAALERDLTDETSRQACHRVQEILSEGHRRQSEVSLA